MREIFNNITAHKNFSNFSSLKLHLEELDYGVRDTRVFEFASRNSLKNYKKLQKKIATFVKEEKEYGAWCIPDIKVYKYKTIKFIYISCSNKTAIFIELLENDTYDVILCLQRNAGRDSSTYKNLYKAGWEMSYIEGRNITEETIDSKEIQKLKKASADEINKLIEEEIRNSLHEEEYYCEEENCHKPTLCIDENAIRYLAALQIIPSMIERQDAQLRAHLNALERGEENLHQVVSDSEYINNCLNNFQIDENHQWKKVF